MQKLATVYLDSHAYMGDRWFKATNDDRHGVVEEHLKDELADGWRVTMVQGFGGVDSMYARGWLIVLLEKP